MTAARREPIDIDRAYLRSHPLPPTEENGDKESRGPVLIVGGSTMAPGSPVLGGVGALRAGAGKVQLAVPASFAAMTGLAFPEAGIVAFTETAEGHPAARAVSDICTGAEKAQVILIGPGLSDEDSARQLTTGLLEKVKGPTYILDAMALTGMKDAAEVVARHEGRIILTPHGGEMAKLSGHSKEEVKQDPVAYARTVADRFNAVVVLKGATTYIVDGDQQLRHEGGVAGLGTAGSGDVLAGIIAGLLARGLPLVEACAWGVFAHAKAGERLAESMGTLGLMARELPGEIPALLRQFEPSPRATSRSNVTVPRVTPRPRPSALRP